MIAAIFALMICVALFLCGMVIGRDSHAKEVNKRNGYHILPK